MSRSLAAFGALPAGGWGTAGASHRLRDVSTWGRRTQHGRLGPGFSAKPSPSCRCCTEQKLRPARGSGPNAGSSPTLPLLPQAAPGIGVWLTPPRSLRRGPVGLPAGHPAHQTGSCLGTGCGMLPPGTQMSPTPFPTSYALAQSVTFSVRPSLTSRLKRQPFPYSHLLLFLSPSMLCLRGTLQTYLLHAFMACLSLTGL